MSPNDFYPLLRARPFVPFRVVTSDGTTYEVRHPELCMVGFPSVIIGYPDPRLPHAYERWDVVSMRHIVRLEPGVVPPASTMPSDGEQSPP
jgi:hypothetical protein